MPDAPRAEQSTVPKHGTVVLTALILVAAVANLNLAVANVALPYIGKDFDASQVEINLVAVGYSLGLAASVLYLGALGDRYGRKMMLLIGTALSIPAALLAAFAKSIALWSGLGGAIAALGPLISGALLTGFDWGSVFLITLPLAVIALYMAWRYVPAHVSEATGPVDNFGGVVSVVLVASLVLAINFAPVPNETTLVLVLAAITVGAAV